MHVLRISFISCLLGTVLLSGAKALAGDIRRTFELPRVEGIEIDGKPEDWKGKGYGFEILLPQYGKHRKAENHNASMTLGWTEEGLWFLVRVQDDVWHKKARQKDPIAPDHVDLYLRKVRLGEGSTPYHLTFNPQFGTQPLKTSYYGGLEIGPGNIDRSVVPTVAITGGKTWYVLEGLVPWESVDLKAVPGAKPLFQLWVQDGDTLQNEELRKHRASFHLGRGTSYNGNDMHVLKLMDDTKPRLRLSAVDGYDLSTFQSYVKVLARGTRQGHGVTIRQGDDVLAKGVFEAEGPDRVSAKIMLPAPKDGKPYENLTVSYEGEDVNTVSLPHSVAVGQLKDLLGRKAEYAKLFKVNEPWVRHLDTPVLEQHRGLVAAAFTLLDRADPPSSQADFALLSQAAEAAKMGARGESYYDQKRGCFFGYIYSNALGTGSYFLCVVPDDYDPSHKYPLVCTLHAGGGVLESHNGAVDRDYIEVFPWGHGYNSFRGLAETAARGVLAYVLQWYSIDENRVYIGGHSNGGNGTWFLTTRYPRLFAGGSVSAGEPLKHLLFENLGNMAILNRCGALDTGQPVNIIQWAESRLKQLGHPMDLRIFPEEGHGRKAPFDSAAWRAKNVRDPSPRRASHSCEWAAHGESYWFTIRRLADPHRLGRVDAEVKRKNGRQTVVLDPTNVEVLKLDVSGMPVDADKGLRISVSGAVREVKAPLPAELYMVRGARGWQLKRTWQAPATKIRPYRSGGAENMYNGDPLLIVYPTLGEAADMARLKEAARTLCRSGGAGEMPTAAFPMKAGKDITQADMEHYNLILIGKIADNRATQKIWPKLPLTLERNKTLKAGGRRLDVENAIVSLHVYNPLAPQRLVYIVTPMEGANANPMWTRALPFFLVRGGAEGLGAVPDLVVRGLTGGVPTFRYGMQFTHGWRWKPQNPRDLAFRFPGIGKDDFIRTSRALLDANSKADFLLDRKGSGTSAPAWGLDTERTTGADWLLSNSGDAVALSVVTGKTVLDLGRALGKKAKGRRGQGLVFYPPLDPAKLNPAKKYTIAFRHRTLRAIINSHGNLPNVEAGPRYTARDVLAELMKMERK
ncbi:MAG: hypothetical protein HN742_19390 [Lentisphaerae bacterium]|jgi:hypothetical protein|nr:hypothetical protein [Lentisphaerota bacterium]MBT4821761.1 hypothetical protein [Lentisphaerota bacterium]MBT5611814.1 hypothetical protein [Lentisphaerota bacterium]MBT7053493.1 hypothetical protein [Lentisphaerota bacterium]MBT7844053.1 hypothetical protein [Lentisphaerota bacterium]